MVFGCSVSFSLMISCFGTTSLFSIGTYIRKRTENYTFINAQIPNCTINGHSSSTGKTSKSPRAFSIYKKFRKISIGNFRFRRARSICHKFHSREPRDAWARFSKAPETFLARKTIAKSRTLRLHSRFIHIFLIRREVLFVQEVSSVNSSPFLDTDGRKIALRTIDPNSFRGFRETGPSPLKRPR